MTPACAGPQAWPGRATRSFRPSRPHPPSPSPYPTTSPGLRALTVANASSASLYKVTIGWVNREISSCPPAASAYAGKREVVLALKPGASAKTMATFPPGARSFCVLDVALAPQALAPTEPGEPPAATPPSESAAPPESGPVPELPAPAETPSR